MSGTVHQLKCTPAEPEEFEFTTDHPRKIEPVEGIPFRWPRERGIANEYIDGWLSEAKAALARLRLSRVTLETIASHISRKDGCVGLTDSAISARSGRSLSSTERDVRRLKSLGFLIAEYQPLAGRQGRLRVLKLSVPEPVFVPQRIPPEKAEDIPSTHTPYVEGIDTGERRNG